MRRVIIECEVHDSHARPDATVPIELKLGDNERVLNANFDWDAGVWFITIERTYE